MNIFEFAQYLRKESTPAEKILWTYLRNRQLKNLKFRRQAVIQYRFIADFYCPELKLIIEVDGKIHLKSEVSKNDYARTKELLELGYRVIRFSNKHVINKIEDVLNEIEDQLI